MLYIKVFLSVTDFEDQYKIDFFNPVLVLNSPRTILTGPVYRYSFLIFTLLNVFLFLLHPISNHSKPPTHTLFESLLLYKVLFSIILLMKDCGLPLHLSTTHLITLFWIAPTPVQKTFKISCWAMLLPIRLSWALIWSVGSLCPWRLAKNLVPYVLVVLRVGSFLRGSW